MSLFNHLKVTLLQTYSGKFVCVRPNFNRKSRKSMLPLRRVKCYFLDKKKKLLYGFESSNGCLSEHSTLCKYCSSFKASLHLVSIHQFCIAVSLVKNKKHWIYWKDRPQLFRQKRNTKGGSDVKILGALWPQWIYAFLCQYLCLHKLSDILSLMAVFLFCFTF